MFNIMRFETKEEVVREINRTHKDTSIVTLSEETYEELRNHIHPSRDLYVHSGVTRFEKYMQGIQVHYDFRRTVLLGWDETHLELLVRDGLFDNLIIQCTEEEFDKLQTLCRIKDNVA